MHKYKEFLSLLHKVFLLINKQNINRIIDKWEKDVNRNIKS